MYEDFYRLLKDEDAFQPEMIEEAQDIGKLKMSDSDYHLRTQIKQNFDENEEIKIYPEKSTVTNVAEHSIGYGVLIYEGYIGEDRVLFTAEDVY